MRVVRIVNLGLYIVCTFSILRIRNFDGSVVYTWIYFYTHDEDDDDDDEDDDHDEDDDLPWSPNQCRTNKNTNKRDNSPSIFYFHPPEKCKERTGKGKDRERM